MAEDQESELRAAVILRCSPMPNLIGCLSRYDALSELWGREMRRREFLDLLVGALAVAPALAPVSLRAQ
jgi:hypothetical protein